MDGSGDRLLPVLQAHRALHDGAVPEQVLRLVLRGHQNQTALVINARLQPGTCRQRVNDLHVQRRETTLWNGKGGMNWLMLLSQSLVDGLQDHLLKLRHLHQFDVVMK